MICERVDLYNYFNIPRESANGGYLKVFARTPMTEIKQKLRPSILVVAGGGYSFVSAREGEPVALDFLANGYNAYVLEYSTKIAYPVPLIEACMAVAYIRRNAKIHCTDINCVVAAGFSAGGHLVGLLATLKEEELEGYDIEYSETKLNAAILAYAVVTMDEVTGGGSRKIISGENENLYDALSVEKRANKNSAPSFIWHTAQDNVVNVSHSMLLAQSYLSVGVPFELHIFDKGGHGLSLSSDETCDQTPQDIDLYRVGNWTNLARTWLKDYGFFVQVKQ